MWHRRLWLIDHGATLYFHHVPGWEAAPRRAREPFPLIKDHVLLRQAKMLEEVDAALAAELSADIIETIVGNDSRPVADRAGLGRRRRGAISGRLPPLPS